MGTLGESTSKRIAAAIKNVNSQPASLNGFGGPALKPKAAYYGSGGLSGGGRHPKQAQSVQEHAAQWYHAREQTCNVL